MTCFDAPPILSFRLLPEKKERAAPGVRKKRAAERVCRCIMSACCRTRRDKVACPVRGTIRSRAAVRARRCLVQDVRPSSRGVVAWYNPRQKYNAAAERNAVCPGHAPLRSRRPRLRPWVPSSAWSPEDTSSGCLSLESKTVSFLNRKEMVFAPRSFRHGGQVK